MSSPCKGASGLLFEKMSLTPKYQELNEFTLLCIWLFGEAWKHGAKVRQIVAGGLRLDASPFASWHRWP